MDKHWANQNISQYSDFDSFVKEWVNETNVNSWVHFVPQHKFIYDDEFSLKVDYVGRLENIAHDFDYVAKKLNLTSTLPYINSSSRSSYHNYYTKETAEIVAQVYAKDIELLKYVF